MKNTVKRSISIMLTLIITFSAIIFSNSLRSVCSTAKAATLKTGDIIEYGSYPQSEVKDSKTLSALNKLSLNWKSYGYYSGVAGSMKKSDSMKYADVTYNSKKYRAVKFSEYRPGIDYEEPITDPDYNPDTDSENTYKRNTVYWFRFDPVKWRILDPTKMLLMSENIIDAQPYTETLYYNAKDNQYYNDAKLTHYANDYATSSIRAWLNDDFYNTAFNSTEKTNIIYTSLDNSAEKIEGEDINDYSSKPTKDKIFLLSLNDITNKQYGFKSDSSQYDEARRTPPEKTSDYSKIQGAIIDGFEYRDDYCWRLRTASYISTSANIIYGGGSEGWGYGYGCKDILAFAGIRPAMRINVNASYLPSKVKDVKLKAKTSSTATLSWSTDPGAQKYYIFKYNSSTKKYTTLGNTTSTSYKITGLKANTTYKFAVQSAKIVNGKTRYGTVSNLITVKTNAASVTKPAQVTGVKLTNKTS
ncbi:MAG: DUF6273 domain-containing protein, partial [Acutalibacteraceae bacterium]